MSRFQLQMKQLDIQSAEDIAQLANEDEDRGSARARQIAVRDKIPAALSMHSFGLILSTFRRRFGVLLSWLGCLAFSTLSSGSLRLARGYCGAFSFRHWFAVLLLSGAK